MSKLLLVDTETTGVSLEHSSIMQIAAIVEIDGVIIDEINIKMRPAKGSKMSKIAMEKTGITIEILKTYQSHTDGFNEFLAFLNKHINQYDKNDKFHLVAYNAKFDSDFLRKMFLDCNHKFYGSFFWSNNICVMVLSTMCFLENRHELKNFKLETVCAMMGITWDDEKSHDAQYDIEQTYKLYKKIME